MSSVLRPVRKRKKIRTLGSVDIVDRQTYTNLALDAKVELIRSLVPLGLMHVEEVLDEEVTALAGERYARKDASVGGRRHGSNPGTVGLAGQRVPIRVPRIRHVGGSAIPLRSLRGAAWRSGGERRVAQTRAVWHLVPQLRSRRRDSRRDRPVRVDHLSEFHPGQRCEAPRTPGAGPLAGRCRGVGAGRQDVRQRVLQM